MVTAKEASYMYWQIYSKTLGYLKLPKVIWRVCKDCGKRTVVSCKMVNGLLYAHKGDLHKCYQCRQKEKQQDDDSLLLATLLS